MADRLNEALRNAREQRANPAPLGVGGGFDAGSRMVRDSVDPRKTPPWLTGGGRGIRENGFSTRFNRDMHSQFRRAVDSGRPYDVYKRSDFTGVYLHDTGENQKNFGDVYDRGRYQGNIRDLMGDDADVVLQQMLFSRDRQAAMNREMVRRPSLLREEIEAQRRERTRDYRNSLAVQKREERLKGWESQYDDSLTTRIGAGLTRLLTGTAGGAGVGFGVGTAFAGVGAVPGAIVGGIGGFGSALLGLFTNQDQQRREYAETMDAIAESWRAGGVTGVGGALVAGGSQLVDGLNPVSDVIQGSADAYYGSVGDGERTWDQANWAFKAADIGSHVLTGVASAGPAALKGIGAVGKLRGAAAADDAAKMVLGAADAAAAGVQSAKLIGASSTLYGVGMGASATGKALQLSQGVMWDDVTGQVHDLEGFGEHAAAAGSAVIDVVQMGRPVALASKTISRITGAARKQAGKVSTEVVGGWRITTPYTADGIPLTNQMRARMNWSAYLAPSEMVQALNTRALAFRALAGTSDKTLTASRIAKVARSIEAGQRPVNGILVNAFGEALEEATQASLETIALDHRWNVEGILYQAAVGAAMGAGGALGAVMNSISSDNAQWLDYMSMSYVAGGEPALTQREFRKLPVEERLRLLGSFDPAHALAAKRLMDKVAASLGHTALTRSEPFITALFNEIGSDSTGVHQSKPGLFTAAVRRVNGQLRHDEMGVSLYHVLAALRKKVETSAAIAEQLRTPISGEPSAQDVIATTEVEETNRVLTVFTQAVENVVNNGELPKAERIRLVNELLSAVWERRVTPELAAVFEGLEGDSTELLRALERGIPLMVRYPVETQHAFVALKPVALETLTGESLEDSSAAIEVGSVFNQGQGLDYDGDMGMLELGVTPFTQGAYDEMRSYAMLTNVQGKLMIRDINAELLAITEANKSIQLLDQIPAGDAAKRTAFLLAKAPNGVSNQENVNFVQAVEDDLIAAAEYAHSVLLGYVPEVDRQTVQDDWPRFVKEAKLAFRDAVRDGEGVVASVAGVFDVHFGGPYKEMLRDRHEGAEHFGLILQDAYSNSHTARREQLAQARSVQLAEFAGVGELASEGDAKNAVRKQIAETTYDMYFGPNRSARRSSTLLDVFMNRSGATDPLRIMQTVAYGSQHGVSLDAPGLDVDVADYQAAVQHELENETARSDRLDTYQRVLMAAIDTLRMDLMKKDPNTDLLKELLAPVSGDVLEAIRNTPEALKHSKLTEQIESGFMSGLEALHWAALSSAYVVDMRVTPHDKRDEVAEKYKAQVGRFLQGGASMVLFDALGDYRVSDVMMRPGSEPTYARHVTLRALAMEFMADSRRSSRIREIRRNTPDYPEKAGSDFPARDGRNGEALLIDALAQFTNGSISVARSGADAGKTYGRFSDSQSGGGSSYHTHVNLRKLFTEVGQLIDHLMPSDGSLTRAEVASQVLLADTRIAQALVAWLPKSTHFALVRVDVDPDSQQITQGYVADWLLNVLAYDDPESSLEQRLNQQEKDLFQGILLASINQAEYLMSNDFTKLSVREALAQADNRLVNLLFTIRANEPNGLQEVLTELEASETLLDFIEHVNRTYMDTYGDGLPYTRWEHTDEVFRDDPTASAEFNATLFKQGMEKLTQVVAGYNRMLSGQELLRESTRDFALRLRKEPEGGPLHQLVRKFVDQMAGVSPHLQWGQLVETLPTFMLSTVGSSHNKGTTDVRQDLFGTPIVEASRVSGAGGYSQLLGVVQAASFQDTLMMRPWELLSPMTFIDELTNTEHVWPGLTAESLDVLAESDQGMALLSEILSKVTFTLTNTGTVVGARSHDVTNLEQYMRQIVNNDSEVMLLSKVLSDQAMNVGAITSVSAEIMQWVLGVTSSKSTTITEPEMQDEVHEAGRVLAGFARDLAYLDRVSPDEASALRANMRKILREISPKQGALNGQTRQQSAEVELQYMRELPGFDVIAGMFEQYVLEQDFSNRLQLVHAMLNELSSQPNESEIDAVIRAVEGFGTKGLRRLDPETATEGQVHFTARVLFYLQRSNVYLRQFMLQQVNLAEEIENSEILDSEAYWLKLFVHEGAGAPSTAKTVELLNSLIAGVKYAQSTGQLTSFAYDLPMRDAQDILLSQGFEFMMAGLEPGSALMESVASVSTDDARSVSASDVLSRFTQIIQRLKPQPLSSASINMFANGLNLLNSVTGSDLVNMNGAQMKWFGALDGAFRYTVAPPAPEELHDIEFVYDLGDEFDYQAAMRQMVSYTDAAGQVRKLRAWSLWNRPFHAGSLQIDLVDVGSGVVTHSVEGKLFMDGLAAGMTVVHDMGQTFNALREKLDDTFQVLDIDQLIRRTEVFAQAELGEHRSNYRVVVKAKGMNPLHSTEQGALSVFSVGMPGSALASSMLSPTSTVAAASGGTNATSTSIVFKMSKGVRVALQRISRMSNDDLERMWGAAGYDPAVLVDDLAEKLLSIKSTNPAAIRDIPAMYAMLRRMLFFSTDGSRERDKIVGFEDAARMEPDARKQLQLVRFTERQWLTMLGDKSGKGLHSMAADMRRDATPGFTSTRDMLARLSDGKVLAGSSSVADISRRVLVAPSNVRSPFSRGVGRGQAAHDSMYDYFNGLRTAVQDERRDEKPDVHTHMESARMRLIQLLQFDTQTEVINDEVRLDNALERMQVVAQARGTLERMFLLSDRHASKDNPLIRSLNTENIRHLQARVAPGDIVYVDVTQGAGRTDMQAVAESLARMANNRGVTIHLVSNKDEAVDDGAFQQYLRSVFYENGLNAIDINGDLFITKKLAADNQAELMAMSRALESDTQVWRANTAVSLWTDRAPMLVADENAVTIFANTQQELHRVTDGRFPVSSRSKYVLTDTDALQDLVRAVRGPETAKQVRDGAQRALRVANVDGVYDDRGNRLLDRLARIVSVQQESYGSFMVRDTVKNADLMVMRSGNDYYLLPYGYDADTEVEPTVLVDGVRTNGVRVLMPKVKVKGNQESLAYGEITQWHRAEKSFHYFTTVSSEPLTKPSKFVVGTQKAVGATNPDIKSGAVMGRQIAFAGSMMDRMGKQTHHSVMQRMSQYITAFGVDIRPFIAEALFPERFASAVENGTQEHLFNEVSELIRVFKRGVRSHFTASDADLVQAMWRGDIQSVMAQFDGSAAAALATFNLPTAHDLTGMSGRSKDVTEFAMQALMLATIPGVNVDRLMRSPGVLHSAGHGFVLPPIVARLFNALPYGNAVAADILGSWNAMLEGGDTGGLSAATLRLNHKGLIEAEVPLLVQRGARQVEERVQGFLSVEDLDAMVQESGRQSQMMMRDQTGTMADHTSAVLAGMDVVAIDRGQSARKKLRAAYDQTVVEPAFGSLHQVMRAYDELKRDAIPPSITSYIKGAAEIRGSFQAKLELRDSDDEKQVKRSIDAFLTDLGFEINSVNQRMVHQWVRQMLGRPGVTTEQREFWQGSDEDLDNVAKLTGEEVHSALLMMKTNLQDGRLPLHGGMVPLLEELHLLKLFQQLQRTGSYQLLRSPERTFRTTLRSRRNIAVTSVEEALFMSLQDAASRENTVNAFTTAIDGFLHTYKNSIYSAMADVSIDEARFAELLQGTVLGDFADRASIDGSTNLLLQSNHSSRWDSSEEFTRAIVEMRGNAMTVQHAYDQMQKRTQRWARRHGLPMEINRNAEEVIQHGPTFSTDDRLGFAPLRIALNLRIINALAHPGLIAVAPLEKAQGIAIDQVTNLLLGTSSSTFDARVRERVTSRMTDRMRSVLTDGGARSVALAEQMKRVNQVLGGHPDFKKLIVSETLYEQLAGVGGRGWIERITERVAKYFAKIQDPAWGIFDKKLAQVYTSAIVEQMLMAPGEFGGMTAEEMLVRISREPLFAQRQFPELHQIAINKVAWMRSTLTTLPARYLNRMIDKGWNSGSHMAQGASFLPKMAFLFIGYKSQYLIKALGLHAPYQAYLMATQGRRTLKGVLTGDDTLTQDHSDLMITADLGNAIVRSGVTFSTMFLSAVLFASLELDGLDDEERERRRKALLNYHSWIYDPSDVRNDFRNAGALFLDNVPLIGALFAAAKSDETGEARTMVQPGSLVEQLFLPYLGFARFMQTGDPEEFVISVWDAIGRTPFMNLETLYDFRDIVDHALGRFERDLTDTESLADYDRVVFDSTAKLLLALERMLFENSFLNEVINSMDRLDRDPYKEVMRDSEENIQRMGDGVPRVTEMLQEYRDPETGEVRKGFVNRQGWEAQLMQHAENNQTFAFLMRVLDTVTGNSTWKESQWSRFNMAARQFSYENTELTPEVLRGAVLSMNDLQANDLLYEYDADGNEALTMDGTRAVFLSAYKGLLEPGAASLGGVYATLETRKVLEEQIMSDLIQEGLDVYDLPEWAARQRAHRVMSGSDELGIRGMRDILYSSDFIPYAQTTKYRQLNMTFATGPDGKYYGTGVPRSGLMNMFARMFLGGVGYSATDTNMETDSRLNSVDISRDLNTGRRGLEKVDESWEVPTEEELLKSIKENTDKIAKKEFKKNEPGNGSSANGFGRYGGRGYSRGGGGGGGAAFTRLQLPHDGRELGVFRLPQLSSGNPIIRRHQTRAEKVFVERGRLKQWQ